MFTDLFLETDRLVHKPFTKNDLEQLHKIVSQKEVVKYLPEDVMSLEETKEILTWLISCYERNSPQKIIKYTVGVYHKEDEKLIGWCGLGPLEFDESEIEVYFGLSQEYWGRGLATESAGAMLGYSFSVIGLDKIVAVVNPENTASKRVIEKLRMTYRKQVKGLPENFKAYEGHLYYSMSRNEYIKTNMG